MATIKQLQEKYKDRIDPSDKDVKEKGIVALSQLQKDAIEQGIDPETEMHWTAGDTSRNSLRQTEEAKRVEDQGDKAANIGVSEDREGVTKVTTEADNKAFGKEDDKRIEGEFKAADKEETAALKASTGTKEDQKEIDRLATDKERRNR